MMRIVLSSGKIWVIGAANGFSLCKFPSLYLVAILFYLFSTGSPHLPWYLFQKGFKYLQCPFVRRKKIMANHLSHGPLAKRWDVPRAVVFMPRECGCVCMCASISNASCGEVITEETRIPSPPKSASALGNCASEGEGFVDSHALTQWSLGLVISIGCILTH